MSGMPGGWSQADTKSEDVRSAARFAVSKLQLLSEPPTPYRLWTVDRAEQQVVAGMNYRIELTTRAPRDQGDYLPELQSWTVTVYKRDWEDFTELTEFRRGSMDE